MAATKWRCGLCPGRSRVGRTCVNHGGLRNWIITRVLVDGITIRKLHEMAQTRGHPINRLIGLLLGGIVVGSPVILQFGQTSEYGE